LRAVLLGTRVAEVSELKTPEVIAAEEIARLAVTVPLIAGRELMVTELPTVTEEMLMGTVPLIDAVTDPIWAVPATRAGSEASETDPVTTVRPLVSTLMARRSVPSVPPERFA
jgi:hypothetical protein